MRSLPRLTWLALFSFAVACGSEGGNGNGNGNSGPVDMGRPDTGGNMMVDMGNGMVDLPTVRATPDDIDFGFVLSNTTVSQIVTLENTSDEDATVQFDNFSNVDLCRFGALTAFCVDDQGEEDGFSLDAGDTLEITVQASAQLAGVEETGSFDVIFCDEPMGCRVQVELEYESVSSAFDCATEEEPFDIGLVNLDSTIVRDLECNQIIALPVALSAPDFESASDDAFSIDGDALAGNVEPGQTIVLGIEVVGDALGEKEGVLRLDYQVGATSVTNRVEVLAEVGGPDLELSREAVDFRRCSTLATCSETVVVSNVGVDELFFEVFLEDQTNATLAADPNSAELQPGESVNLLLSIDAATTGPFAATVRFESTDPDRQDFDLPLSGEAVETGTCNNFAIDRNSVDFGSVPYFRSAQQSVVLANRSGSPCLIRAIGKTLTTDPEFSLPIDDNQFLIPANGQATLPIQFTPLASTGSAMGDLNFQISSPFDPTRTIALAGQAVQDPLLAAAPTEIDLGTIPAGCTTTSTRASLNNLRVSSVTVNAFSTLEGEPAFIIQNAPNGPIQPLFERPFTVDFLPTAAGPFADTIQVQTSAGTQFISLFGERAEDRTETFGQPASNQADVLIVVDNNNANGPNGTTLASTAADWFARAAANGIDLRIGVTSTDLNQEDGLFVPIDGGPERVVDAGAQPTPEEALRDNIGTLSGSSGSVQGLDAVVRAMTPRALSILNPNFYRPGAHLAIVFVQDQADLSAADPRETLAFLDQFKGRRDREAFTVAAVTGGDEGCDEPAKSAQASPRIETLRAATGGPFHSICSGAPFPDDFIDRALGVRESFLLDSVPDPDTIEVMLDGTPVSPSAYSYDADSNGLVFDVAPAAGSQVAVTYSSACDPIE